MTSWLNGNVVFACNLRTAIGANQTRTVIPLHAQGVGQQYARLWAPRVRYVRFAGRHLDAAPLTPARSRAYDSSSDHIKGVDMDQEELQLLVNEELSSEELEQVAVGFYGDGQLL